MGLGILWRPPAQLVIIIVVVVVCIVRQGDQAADPGYVAIELNDNIPLSTIAASG